MTPIKYNKNGTVHPTHRFVEDLIFCEEYDDAAMLANAIAEFGQRRGFSKDQVLECVKNTIHNLGSNQAKLLK